MHVFYKESLIKTHPILLDGTFSHHGVGLKEQGFESSDIENGKAARAAQSSVPKTGQEQPLDVHDCVT